MKWTVSYKSMVNVACGLSCMAALALGITTSPIVASCLSLQCDESLFFHVNGGTEYSAIHAPSPNGVFSIAGSGTRTNQNTNINQRYWTSGASCNCQQPPPNDGNYYKCNAATGTSGQWFQITLHRCIS
jgi:hypothetical protein